MALLGVKGRSYAFFTAPHIPFLPTWSYLERTGNAHKRVGLELKYQNSQEFLKRGHFGHCGWVKKNGQHGESFCLIHVFTANVTGQGNLRILGSFFKVKGNPCHRCGHQRSCDSYSTVLEAIHGSNCLFLRCEFTKKFSHLPDDRDITEGTFLHSSCPQVTVHIVIRKTQGTKVHLSILKQNSLCYTLTLTI